MVVGGLLLLFGGLLAVSIALAYALNAGLEWLGDRTADDGDDVRVEAPGSTAPWWTSRTSP